MGVMFNEENIAVCYKLSDQATNSSHRVLPIKINNKYLILRIFSIKNLKIKKPLGNDGFNMFLTSVLDRSDPKQAKKVCTNLS
jgi:hypothetical protein